MSLNRRKRKSTSTDSRDSYETVVGNSVEKAESTEVVRDKDFSMKIRIRQLCR